ncbi:MAG: hypothetical protein QM518_02205 [Verrucomicrobiota bacterium]|nr:hypothetical protein [Verrucomicrobiota bacterium]
MTGFMGSGRCRSAFAGVMLAVLLPMPLFAQLGVLFSDDFNGATVDPAKWRVSDIPFETGATDIEPIVGGGSVNFYGYATANYWGGVSLASVPTFSVVPGEALVFKVERWEHMGNATASRSGVWVTNPDRSTYLLFADNWGESGWTFNLLTGDTLVDRPTGSGINLPPLDGFPFDDGQFHEIKVMANGQSVRMFVDEVYGGAAPYPFSDDIVFEFGAYARALIDGEFGPDEVDVTFGPVQVERIGVVQFEKTFMAQKVGGAARQVEITVSPTVLASQPISVNVISDNPGVAKAVGADGSGVLTIQFAQGGANTQTIAIEASGLGTATLTLETAADLEIWNSLTVVVPAEPGVQMTDDFEDGTLDPAIWVPVTRGFEETGAAELTTEETGGTLRFSGTATGSYWGGRSVSTVDSYSASPYNALAFEIDRVSIEYTGTAARTGVYIRNADYSQYVFFSQNIGENGWQYNVNPGSPTGGGTDIVGLDPLDGSTGTHKLRLVADGQNVGLYLDGALAATVPFPVMDGIFFEVGTYLRAEGDTGTGVFDNALIETEVPCINVSNTVLGRSIDDLGIETVQVTVPEMFIIGDDQTLVITSDNPAVAAPVGGTDGVLNLTFDANGPLTLPFEIELKAIGTANFTITNTQGVCGPPPIVAAVSYTPEVLLTDDFEDGVLDPALWVESGAGFEFSLYPDAGGTFSVAEANGVLTIAGALETNYWGGRSIVTVDTYNASLTSPLAIEVDRVSQAGTGSGHRTAVWVTNADRTNYVFFAYNPVEGTYWQYNYRVNGEGPSSGTGTGSGVRVEAFTGGTFDDGGNHRMRMVANGQTVKLFLDGVFGIELPFPFGNDLKFEIGCYARMIPDTVDGVFDNVLITGIAGTVQPVDVLVDIAKVGGDIVLTWTATPDVAYQVQSSPDLVTWTDIAGGAVIAEGDTVTWTDSSAPEAVKFYRVIELP